MKIFAIFAGMCVLAVGTSYGKTTCYTSYDQDRSNPIYLSVDSDQTYSVGLSKALRTGLGTLFSGTFKGLTLKNASHPEDAYYESDVTLNFAESGENVFEAYLRLESDKHFVPQGISIAVVSETFPTPSLVWSYPLHCD